VVRFAYAGESTIERRREVKEDGREANERLKGVTDFSGGGVEDSACGRGGGGGDEDEIEVFGMAVDTVSLSLSFPIPM
jgi:hypothetical protein